MAMKEIQTPLVSASWLAANLKDPDLVVLNATLPKVSDGDKAQSLQIEGARFFDIKGTFSDTASTLPNTFPTTKKFEIEARKLGIHANSQIVVYDEHGIYSSARAWWLFKAFGHSNIAVLDGGFPEWLAADYPVEPKKAYIGIPGDFKAELNQNLIKNYQEVAAELNSQSVAILDARSQDRFMGTTPEPRTGLRSGHIPSSINLPYDELLDKYTLKSKDTLEETFKQYEDKTLIMTCGSGITACILALGASIAGLEHMAIYDGSWTEWGSRHDLPIETANQL